MNTLLLTGLPRSGTTLTCALLNQLPDVLALAEPIPLQDVSNRSAAVERVVDFVRTARERALGEGKAPTASVSWSGDNLVAPPHSRGDLRASLGGVRPLRIDKPLSGRFLLCIKHPALFTALAQELMRDFPVFAIVRSPLAALASWQTVDFLPHQGRSVIAERMDPGLGGHLDTIGDRLDRQVALISWYLAAFEKLPEGRVIRYEDLIRNPASQLSLLLRGHHRGFGALTHPILDQAPEDRYPAVDLAELARRLRPILPLIERFYPDYRETLADADGGRRTSLRRRGVDGRSQARIDFFVAGIQKGGTTAAAAYLARHPEVRMANRKEVHFFDQDDEDWAGPDYDRYHAWFQPPLRKPARIGEATPIYMYWPRAMERLRAYNPDAKLIVLLRHPTFRAYSHWRMEIAKRRETLDFPLAIRAEGRDRITKTPNGAHRAYSYVERGLYAPQIGRLLELFPRRQCCFVRTDQLWTAPDGALRKMQQLIGVEPIGLGGKPELAAFRRARPPMPEADRAYLDAIFRDDIRRTQALTGLELSDWLGSSYQEPMAQPEAAMVAAE